MKIVARLKNLRNKLGLGPASDIGKFLGCEDVNNDEENIIAEIIGKIKDTNTDCLTFFFTNVNDGQDIIKAACELLKQLGLDNDENKTLLLELIKKLNARLIKLQDLINWIEKLNGGLPPTGGLP